MSMGQQPITEFLFVAQADNLMLSTLTSPIKIDVIQYWIGNADQPAFRLI